jgi:hypothetical protein
VLVRPAIVVQWHRQGFRLYRRWRSRSGRPSVDREVRDLIRQVNSANPLWCEIDRSYLLQDVQPCLRDRFSAKGKTFRESTITGGWRDGTGNNIEMSAPDRSYAQQCAKGFLRTGKFSWLAHGSGLPLRECYNEVRGAE